MFVKKWLRFRWGLPFLLLLCIGRLWIMPLRSSFWVDEMATQFVVTHGPADPSLRVAPQVPASIYYELPKLSADVLRRWPVTIEVAYRLPSLLCMAGALWFVSLLARRLIHSSAGWFAVFTCLTLKGINYQAADARPYALGTFVFAMSLWFLVRWFDRDRWREAIGFLAGAALLWRVHLVFWPGYVIFAVYATSCLTRRETSVNWLRAGLIFGLTGASLIPVFFNARTVMQNAAAHVVTDLPSLTDLGASLKLSFLTCVFTAVAILARCWNWPERSRPAAGSLVPIIAWWTVHPLALYLFSYATGASVFVPRYLFLSLPAVALMTTFVAALYLPARFWRHAGLVAGLAALLFMGRFGRLWPEHHNSDWRRAAAAVRTVATAGVPVICPSPFIEARVPVWRPDYSTDTFLYSPLNTYRVSGRVLPFPYEESAEAEKTAAVLAAGRLRESGRFVIYGSERSVKFWRGWFRARPEFHYWQNRNLGPFGDVEVVVFEQTATVGGD